nr:hypothetical protein [Myoviridae environmental samples]BAO94932.1 hypothetical protein [Myoviridae environmental samples]
MDNQLVRNVFNMVAGKVVTTDVAISLLGAEDNCYVTTLINSVAAGDRTPELATTAFYDRLEHKTLLDIVHSTRRNVPLQLALLRDILLTIELPEPPEFDFDIFNRDDFQALRTLVYKALPRTVGDPDGQKAYVKFTKSMGLATTETLELPDYDDEEEELDDELQELAAEFVEELSLITNVESKAPQD